MSEEKKGSNPEKTVIIENAVNDIGSNPELGVAKEFLRKNYQDGSAMEEFKQNAFRNGAVKDPVSGLELAPDKNSALQMYGENSVNARSAETDHITPLKQVHKKFRKDPFLNDGDLKKLANRDSNFGMKSRTSNASKGGKTNIQTIKANNSAAAIGKTSPLTNDAKRNLITEQIRSEAGLYSGAAAMTAKNAASEAVQGAAMGLYASSVPIAMTVLKNIVQCCEGEKTANEAAKDVAVTVGSVAGASAATRLVRDAFKNTSNPILTKLLQNNFAPKLVACALYLKDDVNGLTTGKVSKEQATASIISKTSGLFAGEAVRAGTAAALGGAFAAFGGAAIIGTAAAGFAESCVRNLMDEAVGAGAWGMIKDSAQSAQKTADFILGAVNRVEKNAVAIDESIRGSVEDAKDILANLMAFDCNN